MKKTEIYNKVKTLLDDSIDNIFCELNEELDIKYGDVTPLDELNLWKYKENLSLTITDIISKQINA